MESRRRDLHVPVDSRDGTALARVPFDLQGVRTQLPVGAGDFFDAEGPVGYRSSESFDGRETHEVRFLVSSPLVVRTSS